MVEAWAIIATLVAVIWAGVDIIDKYVLTKWVKNPIVPVMITGAISLIAAIIVYLIRGFSSLSVSHIVLAIVAGIFYILAAVLYFRAAKIEEISRIVPLFYLSPVFITILAAIFLAEVFTPVTYIGIALLIIGSILISSKRLKINPGSAFWLMILASLSISFTAIITKYLLNFAEFWTIFSYQSIGAFLTTIPVFYFSLPHLLSTIKKHGKKAVVVMSLNEIFNTMGVLLIILAASLGPVTLISALSSLEPFFVLTFSVILSLFLPKILKEEIDKSTVLLKVVAIALMFVGVVLIT